MSAIDDLLIDAINNGGWDCICQTKQTNRQNAVQFIGPDGKQLFYFNKNCPVHGIGRIVKPHSKQQGSG